MIVVGGKWFLGWFGPDFIAGYPALVLLSVGQFLFSLFGPANTILMIQGKEKYSAICMVVYVLLLVAGCRLLIPVYGVTGAAWAVFGSSLLYNVLLAVVNYRVTGVRSPLISGKLRRTVRG